MPFLTMETDVSTVAFGRSTESRAGAPAVTIEDASSSPSSAWMLTMSPSGRPQAVTHHNWPKTRFCGPGSTAHSGSNLPISDQIDDSFQQFEARHVNQLISNWRRSSGVCGRFKGFGAGIVISLAPPSLMISTSQSYGLFQNASTASGPGLKRISISSKAVGALGTP